MWMKSAMNASGRIFIHHFWIAEKIRLLINYSETFHNEFHTNFGLVNQMNE